MLCPLIAVTTTLVLGSSMLQASHSYGGLVEARDGNPLVAAQVIVEPLDGGTPLVAYTDSRGSFRFSYFATSAFVLRANAYGFQPQGFMVDLAKGEVPARIVLLPLPPLRGSDKEQSQTIEKRSGRQNSGWGADWSSLYTLCAEAPDGFRIRSHAFRLEGDRSCGAWAECRPLEQADSRVCWGFRLQGHSEGVVFGQAVRASEGVLTVTVEPARGQGARPPDGAAVTVYILCGPPTERAATALRSALVSEGWRVAELQALGVRFPSRIVRAGSIEGGVAKGVAQLIAAVRERAPSQEPLPTVSRLEPDAPPEVVEIWLGEGPRQLRSK